jgi:hypothetical protein
MIFYNLNGLRQVICEKRQVLAKFKAVQYKYKVFCDTVEEVPIIFLYGIREVIKDEVKLII